MSSILVTDGEQRSALAVVRSLGRAGHTVHVTSARRHSLAGVSRFAATETVTPDSLLSPTEFADAISQIASANQVDMILPITEASILVLQSSEGRFGRAVLLAPPASAFKRICDKAALLQVASALGIKTPAQQILHSREERVAFSGYGLHYPLVIKPARSTFAADGRLRKTAVAHVADERALEVQLDMFPPAAYPLLLQQRVVGPGVGVFLLVWDGELHASFFHRRIREKPPSGGVSVLSESVRPDAGLLEQSVRLLQAFDWRGVAMVEYKLDRQTGVHYLMEVNGRFWGSLQLAVDAGVDFPASLIACASGRPPQEAAMFKTGVRTRWLLGDVDHLITRIRHSRTKLHIAADSPGRARLVVDFLLTTVGRARNEVFRLSDPLPAVVELADWFRRR